MDTTLAGKPWAQIRAEAHNAQWPLVAAPSGKCKASRAWAKHNHTTTLHLAGGDALREEAADGGKVRPQTPAPGRQTGASNEHGGDACIGA